MLGAHHFLIWSSQIDFSLDISNVRERKLECFLGSKEEALYTPVNDDDNMYQKALLTFFYLTKNH